MICINQRFFCLKFGKIVKIIPTKGKESITQEQLNDFQLNIEDRKFYF